MSNELVVISNNQVPVFKNKELNEITKKIAELDNNVRVNYFKIAIELRWVKDLELYKEDGFSSVTEYANKIFGYSKATVSKMIKIVTNEYLLDDGSGTVFEKEDGQDFSLFQLEELLYLPRGEVVDLVQEGQITPDMTKDQIREAVKAKKSKVIDISEEENDENVEEKSDNILDSSISSSVDNLSVETPSETSQDALESISNSSGVSNYQSTSQSLSTGLQSDFDSSSSSEHELRDSDIDFMISRLNGESKEEYPVAPYELRFFNCKKESSESKKVEDIELDELVYDSDRTVSKELKDCFELLKKEVKRLNHFRTIESARMEELEEEVKRLKEEIIRLTPIKRKRGRPRKER